MSISHESEAGRSAWVAPQVRVLATSRAARGGNIAGGPEGAPTVSAACFSGSYYPVS